MAAASAVPPTASPLRLMMVGDSILDAPRTETDAIRVSPVSALAAPIVTTSPHTDSTAAARATHLRPINPQGVPAFDQRRSPYGSWRGSGGHPRDRLRGRLIVA